MTEEQAIKQLNKLLEDRSRTLVTYHGREASEKAVSKAKSALMKRTPREPIKTKYDKADGYSYTCPSCSAFGGRGRVCVQRWQNYCSSCGQAIDWSVENEL